MWRLAPLGAALWTASFSSLGFAQPPCEPSVARLVSAQGVVEARADAASAWKSAALNDILCPGYMVRVGVQSRAALLLSNDTILRLDQHTTLTLSGVENGEISWLDLISGVVHFISRVPRALTVKTPFVNAAVEGTEFVVTVAGNEASVTVFEGRVWAENEAGRLVLDSGQTAVAQAGQAPVARVVVRPRDAVQWALYYPPIFDRRLAQAPAFTKSFEAYYAGDVAGAIAALDVPGVTTDARLLVHRAALRLVVGRVEEARADIARAQALDPRNVHALAVRSIIALVQNEKDRALALAREAVTLDPQSTPALLALSYAQQASFNIESATDSAEQALIADPDDTYARARLAELRLSLGDLDGALAAAQRAVETDARSARAHTVLGFAHLTRIDIAEARHAFEQAIERDSADPLPRLGLGLTKIRKGKLEAGRREIEIAASLDPNNALVRSYLGKAYYEEKRDPLATAQLDVAKLLDPKDPTPFFYDAIRKQSVNRPVEALEDIQKSVELNDNRAVYRSRLLLDQDEAARNASQARIYSDLGFGQRALLEGWKSVNTDPSNHSGHRLLADTYAALPRHEIARVSELLQSQLLQPLNTTPIQPQLGVADLGILSGTGPSTPSFTEFNPLYTRDGVGVQFDGVAGSNNTLGEDLIVSGIHNQVSYSVGQFHYETEGFRENNDLTQNISNAFMQTSLSPATSLQAEYRYQETKHGDLALTFDPEAFDPNQRNERKNSTGRLGFRHKPSVTTNIIASVIYQDSNLKSSSNRFRDLGGGVTEDALEISTIDSEGYTTELQFLGNTPVFNYVVGAGHFEEERLDTFLSRTVTTIPGIITIIDDPPAAREDVDSRYTNAYLYSYIKLPHQVTLILGTSNDDLTSSDFERDRLNPKYGFMWTSQYGTMVRAAYFKGLARPLNAEQTIEPTQVAGFNQLFDDLPGTKTRRYGLAVEQRITPAVFSGIELSWRDLEVPVIEVGTNRDTIVGRDQQLHRAYLYWTPTRRLALSADYFFEKQEGAFFDPLKLVTRRFPMALNYFWPNGIYFGAIGTYVSQQSNSQFERRTGHETFWVLDAAVGYRLPRRRGIIELVVKNLLDEQFRYSDRDAASLVRDPRGPVFVPERQVFAKFTLSFR